MENKRGQGLSTNAIILIVLGVIVLAVLIAGFALGWGSLKERIAPSNNVDSIVTSCQVACSLNSVYDFCSQERNLKAGDVEITDTCINLNDTYYPQYGVGECPSIDCPASE